MDMAHPGTTAGAGSEIQSDSSVSLSDKYVPCTRCANPIYLGNPLAFVRSHGALLYLRCQYAGCGVVDWYRDSEVILPPALYSGESAPA
jgi:hypothetical protein